MARNRLTNRRISDLLKEIGNNIQQEVQKIYSQGAEEILQDAKSKIHNVSDKLESSGHIKPIRGKKFQKVKIIFDAKSEDGYAYSKRIEFTKYSFLYSAYDQHRDAIKEKALEAIKQAVKKNDRH